MTTQKVIDGFQTPALIDFGLQRVRLGKRLLTVGKKYTALSIEQELRRRGVAATFCPTGQAGVSLNPPTLAEPAARDALKRAEDALGLPACDPLRCAAARRPSSSICCGNYESQGS